ncbi:MAG: hypothetical protein ACPLTR_07275 [Thermacetogeniaceae bacterium]
MLAMESQNTMETQKVEAQSLEELIYRETERRLNLMQQDSYEFPSRIGKGDVYAIVISVIVCLFLIVLCMAGVI